MYFSYTKLILVHTVFYIYLFIYLNGFKAFSFMKWIVVAIIAIAVVAKVTTGKAFTISTVNI